MNSKIKVAVVGVGKQATEDHIPALIKSEEYELVALVEKNEERHAYLAKEYAVPVYQDVSQLMEKTSLEAAILTLPHCEYRSIIEFLASRKVHIIKEKPFAMNVEEALLYQHLIRRHGIGIYVTLQRRFNPIFTAVPQLLRTIGKIFAVEGRYVFNVDHLDTGWRSSIKESGGGALIDMGYHIIDLILWYLGMPDYLSVSTSDGNREGQQYDVEDTVFLSFQYGNDDEAAILGNIVISRVYPNKEERLEFYGTNGRVYVERGRVEHFSTSGECVESLVREGAWPSALVEQYDLLAKKIRRHPAFPHDNNTTLHDHLKHMAIVESGYRSARSKTTVNVREVYGDLIKKLGEGEYVACN